MDGSATVTPNEKFALKSLDVVDAASVDKAVEKPRNRAHAGADKETFVTETMRVRSFQKNSTMWEPACMTAREVE